MQLLFQSKILRTIRAIRLSRMVLIILIVLLSAGLTAACTSSFRLPQQSTEQPGGLGTVTEPEHSPGPIAQVEELIIGMLFISAVVSLVTQWLRIPYTVGLVIVGFILTFFGSIPALEVTPELILALLVPPLVYEAAFHLNFSDLRVDLMFVLMLAVPGVLLTTLLVGGMAVYAGLSLPYALIFGALIAPTDPVSVIALFRSLGAPKRLQVLLEGESLFNDGTAIVLYNLMLAIAVTGTFNLGNSVLEFFYVAGGGVLVGLFSGVLISQLIGRINNALVETSLTTVLAYGSYLFAEYFLGVSGVLAVVAAGLASGHIGPRGMSPSTRIVVFNFWEFAGFLANSFIFLIIGLEIDLYMMVQNAVEIAWGILAVLVARAVVVYGLSSLRKEKVQWKNILFWGGLRGAISLALALSLPIGLPYRTQLQSMAFGVVLFTLIVQGLTMQPLIKRSKVVETNAVKLTYERNQARTAAVRAARARIQRLNHDGTVSDYAYRTLSPILERQYQDLTDSIRDLLEADPDLRQEELVDAWREGLRAQRSALTALFRHNIISDDVYSELVADVDAMLTNPESNWSEIKESLEAWDEPREI